MNKPDLMTQDQAKLVLKKNLENIVKKAADGKVLTRPELEILDGIVAKQDATKPKKVRTWIALAKALGVARQTVWELRDNHGAPKEIDLEAWQTFLEKRASESPHHDNEERQSDEVRNIRTKLLRAQAGKEDAIRKLRELELQRAKAGLVPMGEAKAAIKKVMAPLRGLLDAYPKTIALQANPSDPQLAEEAAREGLQKIFQLIQDEAGKEQNNDAA